MKNERSLYLCHMTAEEKKAYNKRYYEEHKDYWAEYYGREGVAKRNAALSDAIRRNQSTGVNRFKNQIQRQRAFVEDTWLPNGKQTVSFKGARRASGKSVSGTAGQGLYGRSDVVLGSEIPTVKYQKIGQTNRRKSTPDLNSRTAAIKSATASMARLSTPDLSSRLNAMKAYTQPAKSSKLSQITSSAVSKGKSILSNFTSAWKSGLSSIKSAFTPKTTSTLSTKRISTVVTPSGYYQRLRRNINDQGTIK